MDGSNCSVKKITLHERMDSSRCLYKNLMLQIDPLKKSFSQKLQYPEKKIKAINPPKKQLFGESNCSKGHPCKCICLQLLF